MTVPAPRNLVPSRGLAGLLIVVAGGLAAGCDRGTPAISDSSTAPAASSAGAQGSTAPAVDAGRPPADSPTNSRTGSEVGVPGGSPEAGMAAPENTPNAGTAQSVAPSPSAAASAVPAAGSQTGATAPGAAVPLSTAEKEFMAAAYVSGLHEIEVGRIGAERAQATPVKALAGHLVAQHSIANDALRGFAALRNVALPTALPADMQADVDRLKKVSVDKFDETLVQAVVIPSHQDAVARFERAEQNTRDPELKAMVVRMLPVLREHLRSAQTLALPARS